MGFSKSFGSAKFDEHSLVDYRALADYRARVVDRAQASRDAKSPSSLVTGNYQILVSLCLYVCYYRNLRRF